jgi:hypothetical protein
MGGNRLGQTLSRIFDLGGWLGGNDRDLIRDG